MLDKNDVQVIKGILKEQLTEQFAEYKREMTEQFAEHKREMTEQFAEHKKETSEQIAEYKKENESQIKSLEKRIADRIETRARKTERMLIGEMERYHEIYTTRMNRIEKDVADIKQYYRIYKLESSNTDLLYNMVDDLQNRVERLEVLMA